MAGTIDMMNEGMGLSRSNEQSAVQSGGGGGTIEMYATPYPLSQTPVSSVQTGKSAGTIEMINEGVGLSTSATTPYGQKWPADKGE